MRAETETFSFETIDRFLLFEHDSWDHKNFQHKIIFGTILVKIVKCIEGFKKNI